VAGRIVRSIYVPGAFYNPTLDKASEENERRILVIAAASGQEVAVAQIAGVVSRRIVTFAGEGDSLAAGQRFGLIRFGSRVDVYLPPGRGTFVAVGQRAIAGETVFADLMSDESDRQARRS
jgi:phosphatidylserine decarboxylase